MIGKLLAQRDEPAAFEDLIDARPAGPLPMAACRGIHQVRQRNRRHRLSIGRGEHVVFDGQPPERCTRWNVGRRPRRARSEADLPVRSIPPKHDATLVRGPHARDHVEQRRFSGAVRPMMPSTSPTLASKLTSASATIPPKRTEIPSSCRTVSLPLVCVD